MKPMRDNTSQLRARVEQFLYLEARLMDENRYSDWEALWADDGVYWVPCNSDDYDPSTRVSIIHDDRAQLARRVAKLCTGDSHAQDPPSRLRRIVANVEMTLEDDQVVVWSNFLLTEFRNGMVTWAGRTQHRLREAPDGLRIVFKKVILVNNNGELSPLSFLI